MLDPSPDDPEWPRPDPATSPEVVSEECSGPTDFVVGDLRVEDAPREALARAVVSLVRERDYLRKVRDMQQADHESEASSYRDQIEALCLERDALVGDRDSWRQRAERAESRMAQSLSGRVKRVLLRRPRP